MYRSQGLSQNLTQDALIRCIITMILGENRISKMSILTVVQYFWYLRKQKPWAHTNIVIQSYLGKKEEKNNRPNKQTKIKTIWRLNMALAASMRCSWWWLGSCSLNFFLSQDWRLWCLSYSMAWWRRTERGPPGKEDRAELGRVGWMECWEKEG